MNKKLILLPAALAAFTLSACSTANITEEIPSPDTQLQEEQPDYCTDSQLQEEEQQETEQEQQEAVAVYVSYVKVTAADVNLRSGAGTGYTVLGYAEKDTYYACVAETDGWYKIRYLNSYAYISKLYSVIYEIEASENEVVEGVIQEGTKLLGTQYVYGAVRYHDGNGNLNKGFTDTKFDCSSLTQYIFYKGANGLLLGVTTRTQVYQGVTVADGGLQRGDLMFFTNSSRCNNSGIERVGHVALYLGDNLILHTSSDYAKIEALSSQRWSYFIQAQRMV
ncbi:MAG: C40 family peptidase [Clostridia bacterium]|nr:C40 family peptidase [Clostridia bacterium]